MKIFLVAMAIGTVAYCSFVPPIEDEEFSTSFAKKWHGSFEEEYDDSEHYKQPYLDKEESHKTVHVHEEPKYYGHQHYDHHHFDDLNEHHPPSIVNYHDHEHPKEVHVHEKPEVHLVKEPKTVHVHEHHHHHHHRVETLPVSIIKKTVYIKHG